MRKKKIFGIKRKEFVRKEVSLIIVLALLIIIILTIRFIQRPVVGKAYTIFESEHITATVNFPDMLSVDKEFTVHIDLGISGISNGILVTAYIPEGLDVNSITPSNGMFVEDTIVWILSPQNHDLYFDVLTNITGVYDLKVKFGTYDNLNEISEENSAMVMFNVSYAPTADECVSTSDCSALYGETYECVEGICVNICENVDCGPGMNCVNQGGTPMCVP